MNDLTDLLLGAIANAEAFERDVHLDIADARALLAALASVELAATYIELLECSQDGYYRASESPEAAAWELVKPRP